MSQVAPQRKPVLEQEASPILRANGIRKTFQIGDQSLTILKNVNLALRAGEFVAIEGRSGSGKSTLLHILGALDGVDAGSMEFEGQDYTRLSFAARKQLWPKFVADLYDGLRTARDWLANLRFRYLLLFSLIWMSAQWITLLARYPALVRIQTGTGVFLLLIVLSLVSCPILLFLAWRGLWLMQVATLMFGRLSEMLFHRGATGDERLASRLRNTEFGFVFQFYHLLPELNVLENTLLVPMVERSLLSYLLNRRSMVARATAILEQLGMGARLKHRPNQLSGGERQRVAIARALMNNPRVLFADEPTGNLDIETGKQIMGVLEKLHQEQGQTIVMVTHDRSLARRADRVLVMKDGKLEREEV
jgi:ABC-type lipoprotein export system ATPase subunit